MDNENISIERILIKIGVSAHMKGFNYIITAYNFLKKQQIHTNTTTIYKYVANNNDNSISSYSVERAIRQCIISAYKKNNIFKKIYSEKPINAAFLYDLVFNEKVFIDVIN